ncbi:MAG TPA: glycosyltransferase [Bacteroidota bacterium]|nr:glycosyltransferase [Bacteroidota bacterium]
MNENLAGRRIASDMPLVSIVIPVYNGVNYMREAIDSALAQTYPNIEILVINDGSTDDTEQVALSYGNRIRYFSQKNGGQSAALNRGIDEMKGEYFSWLSHDDRFHPTFISQIMASAEADRWSESVFYFSDYEYINDSGKILSEVSNADITPEAFVFKLLYSNTVNGCSVVAPRSKLLECGKFNTARPHTSDVELFIKLGVICKAKRINAVLVQSRTHALQATKRRYKYHMSETSIFASDIICYLQQEVVYASAAACGELRPYRSLGIKWSSNGYLDAGIVALHCDRVLSNTFWLRWWYLMKCVFLYAAKMLRRKIIGIAKSVISR